MLYCKFVFPTIDYILKVFINLSKYCDIFENIFCSILSFKFVGSKI